MMQYVPQPELKNMLAEASHALAHLEADRLEEMALSCAALVRDMDQTRYDAQGPFESGSGEAMQKMAIFARVLEATRTNLNVMRGLRTKRSVQLEYGSSLTNRGASGESNGDN
jgi:hypothetical protein